MAIRVRFSPAPTGSLHVGSACSALTNWLFARHSDGKMLLRIEDTDRERSRPELIDQIFRTLEWLGIDWDEPPVRQSERANLYRDAAEKLLAAGRAYRCECTREAIEERTRANASPGYDGYCRDRNVPPGPGVVLRYRTPDEGTTGFDDVIRGHISFENANLEDFVIMRSDGSATFYLPNAVDDVEMGVTHVIRGEDLINVTPRVLLLREALGHPERPAFAHLPLLVNEKRQKLSKRRDDLAVEYYREHGYLPHAVVNYLATLGWGPPDGVEIRPVEEVVELFRLEDINASPAFFDTKKLDHFNGEHIRRLPTDRFVEAALPWLDERWDRATFERLAPLVQERIVTLEEIPRMVDFLFDEPEIDQAAWDREMAGKRDVAAAILDGTIAAYKSSPWERDALHEALRSVGEAHGLKLNKAQAPVRVAVTGRTVGPPLFESLEVLGRDTTLERLGRARARLADA